MYFLTFNILCSNDTQVTQDLILDTVKVVPHVKQNTKNPYDTEII